MEWMKKPKPKQNKLKTVQWEKVNLYSKWWWNNWTFIGKKN